MLAGNCFELAFEPALAFSHWLGVAVEFAWNFFPSRGSVRGHSLVKLAEECCWVGFLPSWRRALSPYCLRLPPVIPPAPRSPLPSSYREIGKDQRDWKP